MQVLPLAELAPALHGFGAALDQALRRRLAARLGLKGMDEGLLGGLESFLRARTVGYDEFFHRYWGGEVRVDEAGPEFAAFARELERAEPSGLPRPPLCSLLIDEVRAIWADIAERDDRSAFDAKVKAIRASRLPSLD